MCVRLLLACRRDWSLERNIPGDSEGMRARALCSRLVLQFRTSLDNGVLGKSGHTVGCVDLPRAAGRRGVSQTEDFRLVAGGMSRTSVAENGGITVMQGGLSGRDQLQQCMHGRSLAGSQYSAPVSDPGCMQVLSYSHILMLSAAAPCTDEAKSVRGRCKWQEPTTDRQIHPFVECDSNRGSTVFSA